MSPYLSSQPSISTQCVGEPVGAVVGVFVGAAVWSTVGELVGAAVGGVKEPAPQAQHACLAVHVMFDDNPLQLLPWWGPAVHSGPHLYLFVTPSY